MLLRAPGRSSRACSRRASPVHHVIEVGLLLWQTVLIASSRVAVADCHREYCLRKYMMLGSVTLCCATPSPAAPCNKRWE